MKILTWNCGGGFFKEKKYKFILEFDADILVIQECSKPENSIIDEEFKKNYYIPNDEIDLLWKPDYNRNEVIMDDKKLEEKHKKNLGQEGLAIFLKKGISFGKKFDWKDECSECLTWWQDEKTNIPIIKNNKLKSFRPVYINRFDLLLLGVHTKEPEKPRKYKFMGQIEEYLVLNDNILEKCKNIIILGDFNENKNLCWEDIEERRFIERMDKIKSFKLDSAYHINNNVENGEEIDPTRYHKCKKICDGKHKNKCKYNKECESKFPYYRPDHIDYIFFSKETITINQLIIGSKNDFSIIKNDKGGEYKKWKGISDHCPMMIDFNIL
jgi:exonuclease III